MKRYIIGMLVALLCTAGLGTARAHIPSECVGHVHEASERMDLYFASIKGLRGLSASELPADAPEIRRPLQLSLDALEAVGALVTCAMGEKPMNEADPAPEAEATKTTPTPTTLNELLVFAEENEDALDIVERCNKAYYEAYFDSRYPGGSFLDEVEKWARAKARGDETSAESLHSTVMLDVRQALHVEAEIQSRQVEDDDLSEFARDYTMECRMDGLRALAGQ